MTHRRDLRDIFIQPSNALGLPIHIFHPSSSFRWIYTGMHFSIAVRLDLPVRNREFSGAYFDRQAWRFRLALHRHIIQAFPLFKQDYNCQTEISTVTNSNQSFSSQILRKLVYYKFWLFFVRNNHKVNCLINSEKLIHFYYIKMQSQQENLHFANLLTNDLYQFTCSYSYFLSNKHQQQATFEVFFRKYPFGGKYVILGGIRAVKQFLETLQLTKDQEAYLLSLFPHMKSEYFDWLRANLKKKIKVKSFKQGQIVFAKEPLITYTGPIGIVQLFQTPILNLIGFSSLVATNASRIVKVVEPKKCIEFGIRRAQGPDGALTASQFAYLGGFSGTSNIYASQKFGIPCYGTMSHAYVTSFQNFEDTQDFQLNGVSIVKRVKQVREELKLKTHQGELAAFTMFAKSFPDNYVTLIDTYSTLESGILNTIIVAKALIEAGHKKIGIRLDSGDLGAQSYKCRQIWNTHFPEGPRLNILASDDLHEDRLQQMQEKGNEIDVFAIGTHIATCKKQPALGLVCKLVELDGKPKMKISEDGEKATYPSKKSTFRVWTTEADQACFDIISLDGEELKGTIKIADPNNSYELKQVQIKKIKLLNHNWQQQSPYKTLSQCREHLAESKSHVVSTLSIKTPKSYPVMMTQNYLQTFKATEKRNKIAKHNGQE